MITHCFSLLKFVEIVFGGCIGSYSALQIRRISLLSLKQLISIRCIFASILEYDFASTWTKVQCEFVVELLGDGIPGWSTINIQISTPKLF